MICNIIWSSYILQKDYQSLLTRIIMIYIQSAKVAHFITENMYLFTNIPSFPPSTASSNGVSALFVSSCFLDSHKNEIIQYLSFFVWQLHMAEWPHHPPKSYQIGGFLSFYDWIIFYHIHVYILYPFINHGTCQCLCYYE